MIKTIQTNTNRKLNTMHPSFNKLQSLNRAHELLIRDPTRITRQQRLERSTHDASFVHKMSQSCARRATDQPTHEFDKHMTLIKAQLNHFFSQTPLEKTQSNASCRENIQNMNELSPETSVSQVSTQPSEHGRAMDHLEKPSVQRQN